MLILNAFRIAGSARGVADHARVGLSARDHSILLDAPRPRTASGTVDNLPRNFLADWQMRLAGDMGSSNFSSIDSASRALSILGRLASARDEIV